MPIEGRALWAAFVLTALLGLAGCGEADEVAEPSEGPEAPASVAGRWSGLAEARNPFEARLLGCTDDLRRLDGQLAATVGPDCTVLEPAEVVQSDGTFTVLREALVCRDDIVRAASGGGTVDGRTLTGALDLVGGIEVRTRHFRGTVDGDRLSLAFDRLEVRGLSSGTCLISPPLRADVVILR